MLATTWQLKTTDKIDYHRSIWGIGTLEYNGILESKIPYDRPEFLT